MSLLPGSTAAVIATGVAALLLPSFVAGRYHSLVADPELPPELERFLQKSLHHPRAY